MARNVVPGADGTKAFDAAAAAARVPPCQQNAPSLPVAAVADQLHALGVRPGDVLQVHTSFRAVRPVEQGPAGLIAALSASVGPAGTIVMPAWTDDDDAPFDPASTPAATDLGIVADTFRQLPGVRRSAHPFAFAARGPAAAHVLADPLPLPPHIPASPIGRVRELDGKVLLAGVGHDANTTVHLAEALTAVPYAIPRHITVLRDGVPTRVDYREPDCCCRRFDLIEPRLLKHGLLAEGPVGHAAAKLVRGRDVVDAALPLLKRDPVAFLHPRGAGCEECDLAWENLAARGGEHRRGVTVQVPSAYQRRR